MFTLEFRTSKMLENALMQFVLKCLCGQISYIENYVPELSQGLIDVPFPWHFLTPRAWLPILHSSNLTLFQSHNLLILHSSNHTLFQSHTLPILHPSIIPFPPQEITCMSLCVSSTLASTKIYWWVFVDGLTQGSLGQKFLLFLTNLASLEQ